MSSLQEGIARPKARSGSPLMGILAIVAGVVIVMNLFKVSASMSLLTTDLGIDASAGSWLITVCTVAAVILVLPAGGLADRFGPKYVGLFGLACAAAGSAAGALCTSLEPLLVSRAVEGIGYALTGVVSPAIITEAFPAEKRGLPMAIWSCWMDLGMLAVLNVANIFIDPEVMSSWTNLWWLCTVLLVLVFVLYFFIVKNTHHSKMKNHTQGSSLLYGLKSPTTWIVSSIFFLYNMGVLSLLTLAPLYCQMQFGLGIADANSYTSLLTVGMISGAFATGVVLSKVKTLQGRAVMLVASMMLTTLALGWAYLYPFNQIVAFMLLGGFSLAVMPAVGFTLAPDTAPSPALVGTSIGLFMLMGNLAGFSTPVIGAMLEESSTLVALALVVIGFIGVVLSLLFLKMVKNKKTDQSYI